MEVLVVVVVIAILAGIVVPKFIGVISEAEEEACNFTVAEVQNGYQVYMALGSIQHTNILFTQYLEQFDLSVCDCELDYLDGRVQCSENSREDGEDIPIL
ncbi:hypothetical protein [Halalkalibacter krulwichiae]|uniref:hypothetical protein n=1 Tax=Halalkalibacter krulwichiae TaxID=199441 RepID=UPI001C3FDAF2|nr:hypothetical protein [Halalkalibacter krulwichiae]